MAFNLKPLGSDPDPFIHRIPSWKDIRGSIFYGDTSLPAPLLDQCLNVFTNHATIQFYQDMAHDKTLDLGEMDKDQVPKAIADLNLNISDHELSKINHQLNLSESDKVDFEAFCKIIRVLRNHMIEHDAKSENSLNKQNIVDAWTSLGGSHDKTGIIPNEKIKKILVILGIDENWNVDQEIRKIDVNGDGGVDFHEFQALFNET